MSNKSVCISLIATFSAFALPGLQQAEAQQGAKVNLSGAYRCEPQPSPCPGQTISIAQSGSTLELKNEHGSFADAKLTSDITVSGTPPWNSIGIVFPDH